MKSLINIIKEEISDVNSEEIQMYLDVISLDANSGKYDKYKQILRDKFNIDWRDYIKDDEYIQNANLGEIKLKTDFMSFEKYIEYAKKIFELRGLARIQPNHIRKSIDINKATKIGQILSFKVELKEYIGTGNYAEVQSDILRMPNTVDINTFIHELGHIYDHTQYQSENAKILTNASSFYGINNGGEVFAENFMHYFIAPEFLQQHLPEVYADLDRNINPTWKKTIQFLIKEK